MTYKTRSCVDYVVLGAADATPEITTSGDTESKMLDQILQIEAELEAVRNEHPAIERTLRLLQQTKPLPEKRKVRQWSPMRDWIGSPYHKPRRRG